MGIRVNFGDTTVGDYKPVDPGWYLATITETEKKEAGQKAKNPGSEYIKVEFTLNEPSDELPSENKKVFANASLLPNALYTLMEICAALDVDTSGDDVEIDYDDWEGKQVAVKLNQYEYDGDMQNGVKRIAKPEVYYEKRGAGSGSMMP